MNRHLQRYYNLKNSGKCVGCGGIPREGKIKCKTCAEIGSKRTRSSLHKRIARGQCTRCDSMDLVASSKLCRNCLLKRMAVDNLKCEDKWVDLLRILEQQNYRCAYTGELLVLGKNASVDHILPRKRYPEQIGDVANIQWVTFEINVLKRDRTHEEFMGLIASICKYRGDLYAY